MKLLTKSGIEQKPGIILALPKKLDKRQLNKGLDNEINMIINDAGVHVSNPTNVLAMLRHARRHAADYAGYVVRFYPNFEGTVFIEAEPLLKDVGVMLYYYNSLSRAEDVKKTSVSQEDYDTLKKQLAAAQKERDKWFKRANDLAEAYNLQIIKLQKDKAQLEKRVAFFENIRDRLNQAATAE